MIEKGQRMNTGNKVYEASKEFALRIVRMYQYLTEQKREYTISKQALRCGTSIGANISEALMAQSRADFISKLHVALKECNETLYWLELLYASGYIDKGPFESMYGDCRSILRLLIAIIKTCKSE